MIYKTTSREGYQHYRSNPEICRQREHLKHCAKSTKYQKTPTRRVWEDSKERIHENRLSEAGKAIYQRRKETVKRSFADTKELHAYRYAR